MRRLRLFNEKADKLLGCSFVQKVFIPNHGFTISFGENKPLVVERRGADEEATDALSLTLRLFLMKRDGLALEQMRGLYASLPIPEDDKRKVREAFERLDRFMASGIGVVFKGKPLTHRDVLETVLYGDLAHVNDDKRPIIEEWRDAPGFETLIRFYYEDAVARLIQFVAACRDFNDHVLECLHRYGAV